MTTPTPVPANTFAPGLRVMVQTPGEPWDGALGVVCRVVTLHEAAAMGMPDAVAVDLDGWPDPRTVVTFRPCELEAIDD